MGGYGKRLAVIAAACAFIALTPAPGHAQGALTLKRISPAALVEPAPLHRITVHRKRVSSFYCYPRKWWFYRPYTTDPQNHDRCMPYFHYLGPGYGRGAKGGGYPK